MVPAFFTSYPFIKIKHIYLLLPSDFLKNLDDQFYSRSGSKTLRRQGP